MLCNIGSLMNEWWMFYYLSHCCYIFLLLVPLTLFCSNIPLVRSLGAPIKGEFTSRGSLWSRRFLLFSSHRRCTFLILTKRERIRLKLINTLTTFNSFKNEFNILSSSKRGRLLMQIMPKNVIYIFQSFCILKMTKIIKSFMIKLNVCIMLISKI